MVRKSTAGVKLVRAGRSLIGPGRPIFIIAEIGINHNQDLQMAKDLIDAAAAAGCDAAKFQTFTAKALYVDRKFAGTYHLMGRDIPIYDLHTKLEMPYGWIPVLRDHCKKLGILFFSTPVDAASADALDCEGVELFKVSSYDMTNLPLVRHLAKKGKTVIFSAGAATLGEVEETVAVLEEAGCPYAMMHCIAKYPAPYRYANLAVMETLRRAFGAPVGFSDNGFADARGRIDALRVPSAAAAAGADLFEVHITLDRKLPGADHGFATTPCELKAMVAAMRRRRDEFNRGCYAVVEPLLLGSPVKKTYDVERYVRDFAYKCLFAIRDIPLGAKIRKTDVAILRPGAHRCGLAPKFFALVVGKARASRPIARWQPITWDNIL